VFTLGTIQAQNEKKIFKILKKFTTIKAFDALSIKFDSNSDVNKAVVTGAKYK